MLLDALAFSKPFTRYNEYLFYCKLGKNKYINNSLLFYIFANVITTKKTTYRKKKIEDK